MCCLIVALIQPPGGYWLISYVEFGQFALVLLSLVYFQGGGKSDIGIIGLSFFLITIDFSFMALILAFPDWPPLDSPLARIADGGRYYHMMALRQLARSEDFTYREPSFGKSAIEVEGMRNGRPFAIASGAKYQLSSKNAGSFRIAVALPIQQPYPACWIGFGDPGGKGGHRETMRVGPLKWLRLWLVVPQIRKALGNRSKRSNLR